MISYSGIALSRSLELQASVATTDAKTELASATPIDACTPIATSIAESIVMSERGHAEL